MPFQCVRHIELLTSTISAFKPNELRTSHITNISEWCQEGILQGFRTVSFTYLRGWRRPFESSPPGELPHTSRPVAASPRTPQTANGSTDEREEQSQDARDAQNSAQPLLRGGLLGALLRSLWQRNAGELIYETDP